jgi:uncharacterized protein (TIGR02588 family)
VSAGAWRRLAPAEWVTLAIGLLVVGVFVAVAVGEEIERRDDPPGAIEIVFDATQAERQGSRWFVPYLVRNTGSAAIDSAEIWIEVYAGEELVDTAEISVQSLPLDGTQLGVYVTELDPDAHTIQGRLESLQFP